MKFVVKLLLGSSLAACCGIWWLIDGVCDGPMNQLVGGMLWKGPIMVVVGAAGAFMGLRMLKELLGRNHDESAALPNPSNPHEPTR